MPKISVIMPVYNGAAHIREAIESVLAQTFTDWDFWIINEFGSNDGTVEIVNEYAKNDARFHLIQNESRQGLAESINIGFRAAQGQYFARLDADDLAHPERFAKQAALMDENPQVGVCGTYQHHFGAGNDWIHCPPCSAEDCRARLVFNCDLCHSTLMLRRETVLKYGLFYDPHFAAEDYELWGRVSLVCDIVNIPEVLGEYRHDGSNITEKKLEQLDIESGRIVGENLARALDMHLTEEDCRLFQSWRNPFDHFPGDIKEQKLQRLEEILREIYKKNLKKKVFNNDSLLSTLACKWRWAKYYAPWNAKYTIAELDEIFDENYRPSLRIRYKNFCAQNRTLGAKIRKIIVVLLRPLARPFRRRMEGMLYNVERNVCNYIEDKTWDRYLRLEESSRQIAALIREEREQMDRLLETVERRVAEIGGNVVRATEDRILKAEGTILKTMDERAGESEENILRTVNGRIGEAEKYASQQIEWWTWERYSRQREDTKGIHNHIEITYRDLMIALNNQLHFVGEHDVILKTDYPIASGSIDTKFPHGTAQDNTRYPRFIKKCETIFKRDSGLSFLDLGCSGGGMVLDAILRGHLGIGLEGSDYSLIRQRAEWRLLRDNLFTCDITKPFALTHGENGPEMRFDVITAWEVLEHILEDDLPQLFQNIRNHLKPGGLFVGSVARWDDIDPKTGVNWHVTVHPAEWWEKKFEELGFETVGGLFEVEDMARGGVNHPISWLEPIENNEPNYLAVLKVRE